MANYNEVKKCINEVTERKNTVFLDYKYSSIDSINTNYLTYHVIKVKIEYIDNRWYKAMIAASKINDKIQKSWIEQIKKENGEI